jgi:hypothetical protein
LADHVVHIHTTYAKDNWFTDAMPYYAESFRTALTDPRRAVARLITDMGPAGWFWPDCEKCWLRILLRVMECLHPIRATEIDPNWRTADTLALARGILEDRASDRLPILADALTDAGCENDSILSHCQAVGEHLPECWAMDIFGLGGPSSRHTRHESEETPVPTGRTIPIPGRGRQPRVTEGMAAVARLAGAAHPNLVAFASTGTLRDEAHRAAVQAELAVLAVALGSDAEARPLTRLLEIIPSAPVGVCIH